MRLCLLRAFIDCWPMFARRARKKWHFCSNGSFFRSASLGATSESVFGVTFILEHYNVSHRSAVGDDKRAPRHSLLYCRRLGHWPAPALEDVGAAASIPAPCGTQPDFGPARCIVSADRALETKVSSELLAMVRFR